MAAVKDVKPQLPHLIDELEESFQVNNIEHSKLQCCLTVGTINWNLMQQVSKFAIQN